MRKTPGVQVALLKRWRSRFISRGDSNLASESKSVGGESIVVCTTHFRASADDHFRMQQASGVVKALHDFSRDEPQIIMADLNSQVRSDAEGHGKVDSVTVEPALWHVMLRLACMLVLCRTVVSRMRRHFTWRTKTRQVALSHTPTCAYRNAAAPSSLGVPPWL